jgi:hypothetical protein
MDIFWLLWVDQKLHPSERTVLFSPSINSIFLKLQLAYDNIKLGCKIVSFENCTNQVPIKAHRM